MATVVVLPSQRNEILQTIQRSGLDPTAFEWRRRTRTGAPQETEDVLGHKNSRYYFAFRYPSSGGARHAAEFSPGKDRIVEYDSATDWPSQLGLLKRWLENLKRELGVPDLWGALRDGAAILEGSVASAGPDNSPLNATERERIASALSELKEYAEATYQLTSDQTAQLGARVEYLIGASERLGRKDWINALVGVLMGYVITVALPAEQARDLIQMAGRSLNWLLQSVPLLLP